MVDRLLTNAAGRRLAHRLYLPFAVCAEIPDLEANPFPAPGQLYSTLVWAGHTLTFTEYVRARIPTPDDTAALRIPDATPMLVIRRVTRAPLAALPAVLPAVVLERSSRSKKPDCPRQRTPNSPMISARPGAAYISRRLPVPAFRAGIRVSSARQSTFRSARSYFFSWPRQHDRCGDGPPRKSFPGGRAHRPRRQQRRPRRGGLIRGLPDPTATGGRGERPARLAGPHDTRGDTVGIHRVTFIHAGREPGTARLGSHPTRGRAGRRAEPPASSDMAGGSAVSADHVSGSCCLGLFDLVVLDVVGDEPVADRTR